MNAGETMTLSGSYPPKWGGSVADRSVNITQPLIALIFWADPFVLTGNVTLSTGSGIGNIQFSNTIDGSFCLTLQAGSGNIILNSPVGSITALNCFTGSGASIFQNSSIQTTGAVQETGNINLGGNITTSQANITLTGNVTLTSTSPVFSAGNGSWPIFPSQGLSMEMQRVKALPRRQEQEQSLLVGQLVVVSLSII